jgi:16S rRNA (cytosine1402-N4)-methyltransferase
MTKIVLKSAERLVRPGGRVSVISFHSIEDRVVKQWLKESESFADVLDGPRSPSDDEVLKNPRSRSAKLRVAEKRP